MIMRAHLAVLVIALVAAQRASAQQPDPHIWLEQQTGDRAMAWVRAENAKTTAVLEKDPHFSRLYAEALTVAQSNDRIPDARFIGGELYNFWQDSVHVRGIWRRTTLASYRTASPKWTTVLDLDSLARAEKANWVWQFAECVPPAELRWLIALSNGRGDASSVP